MLKKHIDKHFNKSTILNILSKKRPASVSIEELIAQVNSLNVIDSKLVTNELNLQTKTKITKILDPITAYVGYLSSIDETVSDEYDPKNIIINAHYIRRNKDDSKLVFAYFDKDAGTRKYVFREPTE